MKRRTSSAGPGAKRAVLLCLTVMAVSGGCSNRQRLPQYDFRNRTLSVVTIAPGRPEVLGYNVGNVRRDDSLETILGLGSAIAMEVSARQARPRLESAAETADVEERMTGRVLEGAARHLRAVPVENPGNTDFEIEIRIHRYGITANSWSSAASFLIDAELYLLDGSSGRRIWKDRVRATSPLRPMMAVGGYGVDGAVTAIALANMSTEEIQHHLEALADFSSDRLLAAFIRALDQARG